MLTEAVAFLEETYGKAGAHGRRVGIEEVEGDEKGKEHEKRARNGKIKIKSGSQRRDDLPEANHAGAIGGITLLGWEILIISDGSSDQTERTALDFARSRRPDTAAAIRVVSLQQNRGKGGSVTHGMRHVRGEYVVFADADGASTFSDLPKLLLACQAVEDGQQKGVAVGSRAHLVGSEAVVTVGYFFLGWASFFSVFCCVFCMVLGS